MSRKTETQKTRRTSALELFNIAIGLIILGLVILLRVCEVNNLFYRIVIAIQFIWLILNTFLLLARAAEATGKAYRRFKTDRRIIRQAKNLGVWGKPWLLGGRALELYAKKKLGIKRKPGQPDQALRYQCLIKAGSALTMHDYCEKETEAPEAIEAESKK